MKTVRVSGKQLEKLESLASQCQLTDLEKRRQPLRELLSDIGANHWHAWVNAWSPLGWVDPLEQAPEQDATTGQSEPALTDSSA